MYVQVPLFQALLFKRSSGLSFCTTNGPNSSIPPNPIDEHPGPVRSDS